LAGSGFLNGTSLVVRSPGLHQSPTCQLMPSAGAPMAVPPPVVIAAAAPRKTCRSRKGSKSQRGMSGKRRIDSSAQPRPGDGDGMRTRPTTAASIAQGMPPRRPRDEESASVTSRGVASSAALMSSRRVL
jgi:hypothetical protein